MFEITKRNVTLSLNSFTSIYGEVFTFDKSNFSITDGNFVKEWQTPVEAEKDGYRRSNISYY